MRIAFTGDRYWRKEYFSVLYDFFEKKINDGDHIILGDCPTGVDRICLFYCVNNIADESITWDIHKADWSIGKGGGHVRNKAMLDNGAEALVAVHENFDRSKGTLNCVRQALKRDIPVTYLLDKA